MDSLKYLSGDTKIHPDWRWRKMGDRKRGMLWTSQTGETPRNSIRMESQTPEIWLRISCTFVIPPLCSPMWEDIYCALSLCCSGLRWARYKSTWVKRFSIRKSWWIFVHLSEASFTLNRVCSISFTNHLGHVHNYICINIYNFLLSNSSFKWDVDPKFSKLKTQFWRKIFFLNHKSHLGDLGDIGVETPLRGDLNSSGWYQWCCDCPIPCFAGSWRCGLHSLNFKSHQPGPTRINSEPLAAHWDPSPRLWIPHAWDQSIDHGTP